MYEEEGFVPIEDVVGPYIEYHVDPEDRKKVIIIQDHVGDVIQAVGMEKEA